MRDETTRRNAEGRSQGRVVEAETEQASAPVDEDAAAFLRDAAEAAASAALEAESLASEVAGDAAHQAIVAAAADEAAALDPAAEDDTALDAAADDASRGDTALEAAPAEEAVGIEAELAAAGEAIDALDAAADELAEAFAQADATPEAVEYASFDAYAKAKDAAVQAEIARELSDEAPTAEEQLLAQAEEERDPEDEIAPADIAEPDDELQASFDKIAVKARRLDEDQARHVIHSVLFVSDKPLTVEHLRNATGLEPARVRASLERLAGELREGLSGVVLSEVSGAWQMRTAPESADFVRRFLQVKPRRLTRAALETLAIIAYRQPVTRPEIEDIRGVDCGAVVKALLDWKLIKILGKKDEVGRPLLYGTSREFLEFFQLKDLASLPTLREFHELNEESVQIVEEELGPEAAAGIAGTVAELTDPAYLEAEKERVAKSEQALAELEQALADAEAKSSDVSQTINPPKEPEVLPEVEGDTGS